MEIQGISEPSRPPYSFGQDILDGKVYRRIPPRRGYSESGRPTFRAFIPREQDHGALSVSLAGYVSADDARMEPTSGQAFGLCELDIAAIRRIPELRVVYWPTSRPLGHAHARITGCHTDALSSELARIADTIFPP
jgi:hypothetical protein